MENKPGERKEQSYTDWLADVLKDNPEFATAYSKAIVDWTVRHPNAQMPIFINPLTGKPQWANREMRRRLSKRGKK